MANQAKKEAAGSMTTRPSSPQLAAQTPLECLRWLWKESKEVEHLERPNAQPSVKEKSKPACWERRARLH